MKTKKRQPSSNRIQLVAKELEGILSLFDESEGDELKKAQLEKIKEIKRQLKAIQNQIRSLS
jgi:hypothetical protein